MLMHFATTGTKFPYSYYLGIKSASKFGEVKLWYLTKPNSEYFDKIVKEVPSEQVSIPDFPALKNRDEHFNLVSKFDYIIWKVISKLFTLNTYFCPLFRAEMRLPSCIT